MAVTMCFANTNDMNCVVRYVSLAHCAARLKMNNLRITVSEWTVGVDFRMSELKS